MQIAVHTSPLPTDRIVPNTKPLTSARCRCGAVEVELLGGPIVSVVCYCDDCQEGSRRLEALPGAQPVREPDGGTAFVAYRKDRVRCSSEARLEAHKLRPESATQRVVAACCNSAMLLRFDGGKHWWTDVYRARLVENAPPSQMRICTKFRKDGAYAPLAHDIPSFPGYPVRFIARLVAARLGMLGT